MEIKQYNEYDKLQSKAYELANKLEELNPSSAEHKTLSQEYEKVRDQLDNLNNRKTDDNSN